MNRFASVKFLAAVGVVSLLLSGSVQAASTVSIGAPTLISATTLDMTNDIGAGMTTNVDWIHFLSGNVNLHGQLNASATVAPDLAKNAANPYISRTILFTEHSSATVNDWPETRGGSASSVSYTYSDAASVSNPGSTATEGIFQAGDLTLTINVPDTNPYVLRIYGRDRWAPLYIKGASLSDGAVAGQTGAGGGSTDLYRFDIAYQAQTAGQTLTVNLGYTNNSQGVNIGTATLSTVPEPVSLGTICLGALGLLRRRRA